MTEHKESGEHWLAVKLTEVEGGSRQVNVADMSEIVLCLQGLLASPVGWAVHSILMRKVWDAAPDCEVKSTKPPVSDAVASEAGAVPDLMPDPSAPSDVPVPA